MAAEEPPSHGFYLNVIVVDASAAISGKVDEKVSNQGIFGSFLNKVIPSCSS